MKLLILLGGPFHNTQLWKKELLEAIELRNENTNMMFPTIEQYRLAFWDDYVGIYYWRLDNNQINKIRQQVNEERVRYNEVSGIF